MEGGDKSWNYAKLSFQALEDSNKPRSSRLLKGDTDRSKGYEVKVTARSNHTFTRLDDSGVPVDEYSKIYMAFVLSGIGYMLPYTCFITAVDYYQNRFPESTIIFDMTTTTIIIGTFGVVLNNAVVESVSLTSRVMCGYIISTSLLLFLMICDLTAQMFQDKAGYWVTLVSVAVIAIGCSVQQSSFYGYANMMPRRYTQAVMVGESFAGVLVSLNRIITKLLLEDERINTIIFFIISIVIMVICCGTFFLARHTRFVEHHLNTCKADRRRLQSHDGTEFTLTQGQLTCFEFEVPGRGQEQENIGHLTSANTRTDANTEIKVDEETLSSNLIGDDLEDFTGENSQLAFKGRNSVTYGISNKENLGSTTSLVRDKHSLFKARLVARWEVAKQIYPFMMAFGLTFYVTVSLYPGIISEVVSCHLGTWMPVILMACFNVTDAFGKTMTSLKQNHSRLRLLLCSLTRVCLIPLAVLCCTPRLHPILNGEAWPILVAIVLGISNGYFGSLPIVMAPSQVAPRYRELCGNTMMLSFTVAIIFGAFTSYALDLLIGPHPDLEFCRGLQKNSSLFATKMGDELKHGTI